MGEGRRHGAPGGRLVFAALFCLVCLTGLRTPGAAAGAPAPVWAVAFSPDGRLLAAGGYQQVQLWDVAGRAPVRILAGHAGPVRCLAWSADGRLAGGGGLPGEAGEVKVWQGPFEPGPTPLKPTTEMREHRDVVEGIAFTSSGDALLSGAVDEKALAVRLDSRKVVAAMQDHTSRISGVAASPSGRYVATASLDKTVKIWSAADFRPLANVDAGAPIQALAYLPAGGEGFAVALEDGNTRLYRLNEGRSGGQATVNINLVRTINGNRTPLFALALAPRGGLLATGGSEGAVNVYDLQSGNRRHALRESPAHIYGLAFSPDGTLLAAACRDGKVRLWTMADGKPAGEL